MVAYHFYLNFSTWPVILLNIVHYDSIYFDIGDLSLRSDIEDYYKCTFI
jgi:hypothetical protein